jgi:hypothetical protein
MLLLKKKFYFPLPTDYIDYDFNDTLTLEGAEDFFWESGYSAFSHDDTFYLKF